MNMQVLSALERELLLPDIQKSMFIDCRLEWCGSQPITDGCYKCSPTRNNYFHVVLLKSRKREKGIRDIILF